MAKMIAILEKMVAAILRRYQSGQLIQYSYSMELKNLNLFIIIEKKTAGSTCAEKTVSSLFCSSDL
jgi:hypothetical protein